MFLGWPIKNWYALLVPQLWSYCWCHAPLTDKQKKKLLSLTLDLLAGPPTLGVPGSATVRSPMLKTALLLGVLDPRYPRKWEMNAVDDRKICIYIYTHIHIQIHVYTYINLNVHTHIYIIYTYIYIYTYIHYITLHCITLHYINNQ